MDSTNQNPTDAQQATTTPPADSNGEEGAKIYGSRADAEANKPANLGKKKLYRVAHQGATRYLYGNGYDSSLAAVARADGYVVSLATAEASEDAVKAALAGFSDEQLAAMGLSRTPAPTAATNGTSTKPTRGRK